MNLNEIDKDLLKQVADLHKIPLGSYNIRKNGKLVGINSTPEIIIEKKEDKDGINIYVTAGTKNKSLHIPVIVTEGDVHDLVYNDFYIAEDCDVLIVAGCGIHNNSDKSSEHNGIHTFHISKNSKVKYVEKHLGLGTGKGDKILNPTTKIYMKENSQLEMETLQLGGVSYSNRVTYAKLAKGAKLNIKENVLTTETQEAKTKFNVDLVGKNSSITVTSRSVAKDNSKQTFVSNIKGKTECYGRVECDGIIVGNGKIISTPQISALDQNANLVHEAQVGKIAGEQLDKLMTLGLSYDEACNKIISGYLK